jgi:hypothetical protein
MASPKARLFAAIRALVSERAAAREGRGILRLTG